MPRINVVDAMMGAGKSSAAINLINNSDPDTHFIVITPYLKEVDRYMAGCPHRKFHTPKNTSSTKLKSIKKLIGAGCDIVSTHALFRRFDQEVISVLKAMNYVLIMDEAAQVIEKYEITKPDVRLLIEGDYVIPDPETDLLSWREGAVDYTGKFNEVKNLCGLGSLALYGDDIMLWLFPVEVFSAFTQVYVLTYMFDSQPQKYYFDYYGIDYNYLTVAGDSRETYTFSDLREVQKAKYNYRKLIHICDNSKLNRIGDDRFALTRAWYDRNMDSGLLTQLKNNVYNYFRHIMNSKSSDILWTTFMDYRSLLKGNGYGKSSCFLALNARATNEKADRTEVAYTINCYMNPLIKQFFITHGVEVDEEGYALSEMIQFIWRSAIRNGQEIWVYVPSSRMRELLICWIDEISIDVKGEE